MGLTWSLSALVATVAVLIVFGAIWSKAKAKKDSPAYRIMNKFKRTKSDDDITPNEEKHYRRIYHRGGIKY